MSGYRVVIPEAQRWSWVPAWLVLSLMNLFTAVSMWIGGRHSQAFLYLTLAVADALIASEMHRRIKAEQALRAVLDAIKPRTP